MAMSIPADTMRLVIRHGLLVAEALAAAGLEDSARAELRLVPATRIVTLHSGRLLRKYRAGDPDQSSRFRDCARRPQLQRPHR
jgi:hypothetical protein